MRYLRVVILDFFLSHRVYMDVWAECFTLNRDLRVIILNDFPYGCTFRLAPARAHHLESAMQRAACRSTGVILPGLPDDNDKDFLNAGG